MRVIEYESRHRGTQDTGHRQRGNEQRNDVGLVALAEPISQIQDDTGEEAGFGNAKQKSRNCCTFCTPPAAIATMPQVTRMRPIHMRAPTR